MKQEHPSEPWWKYGYVWLVIAGPVIVVVAALTTAWIAAASPDPVLAEVHHRNSVDIDKSTAKNRALMPALQGRNHAATPPPVR